MMMLLAFRGCMSMYLPSFVRHEEYTDPALQIIEAFRFQL